FKRFGYAVGKSSIKRGLVLAGVLDDFMVVRTAVAFVRAWANKYKTRIFHRSSFQTARQWIIPKAGNTKLFLLQAIRHERIGGGLARAERSGGSRGYRTSANDGMAGSGGRYGKGVRPGSDSRPVKRLANLHFKRGVHYGSGVKRGDNGGGRCRGHNTRGDHRGGQRAGSVKHSGRPLATKGAALQNNGGGTVGVQHVSRARLDANIGSGGKRSGHVFGVGG